MSLNEISRKSQSDEVRLIKNEMNQNTEHMNIKLNEIVQILNLKFVICLRYFFFIFLYLFQSNKKRSSQPELVKTIRNTENK